MSVAPPWSVFVKLAEVDRGVVHRSLDADEVTRRRIADLLDLVALERLTSDVSVAPWLDGALVKGDWRARVVQTCSLSAEEFATDLDGVFEVRCVPAGSPLAENPSGEIVVDPDADDPPDVLESDVIDLGAYLVEHLALALDPFPRAPGVAFEPPPAEPEPNPFAKLIVLKQGGGGG